MARWHAEATVVSTPAGAAWGARLLTTAHHVAWQGAERWATPERAVAAALTALQQAARAHRVTLAALVVTPTAPWPAACRRVPDLPAVTALAAPLVAPAAVRLERVAADRAIAHGQADYLVDLRRGTCTCPAFRFRPGPCKHLRAAAGR